MTNSSSICLSVRCLNPPPHLTEYSVKCLSFAKKNKVFNEVSSTEFIQHSNNHSFKKLIKIGNNSTDKKLRFQIVSQKNHVCQKVGFFDTCLNDIVTGNGNYVVYQNGTKNLLENDNNTFTMLKLQVLKDERVTLQLGLEGMKSKNLSFYFIILKKKKKWLNVYKSEFVKCKKNSHFAWKVFSIKTKHKHEKMHMILRLFQCGFVSDKLIAESDLFLDDLVAGNNLDLNKKSTMSKKLKNATFKVLSASWESDSNQTANDCKEDKSGADDLYTFNKYLRCGLDFCTLIAMDFSLDNCFGGLSLHDLQTENEYQRALKSCMEVSLPLSSDENVHLWGFAGRIQNTASDCFLLTFDPARKVVRGMQDVLFAYQSGNESVMPNELKTLSGVLSTACVIAQNREKLGNFYLPLFILIAAGDFVDYEKQASLLNRLKHLPMVVFYVGVGPGDFSKTEDFVASFNESSGSVCFINYNKELQRKTNDMELVSKMRAQMEKNVCEYFSELNKMPKDMICASKSNNGGGRWKNTIVEGLSDHPLARHYSNDSFNWESELPAHPLENSSEGMHTPMFERNAKPTRRSGSFTNQRDYGRRSSFIR